MKQKILIKMSGEILKSSDKVIDRTIIDNYLAVIKELINRDYEVYLTVGGGNIFRGRDYNYLEQTEADQIGMLATVINALVLQSYFFRSQIKSKILSMVATSFTETFSVEKATDVMRHNQVLILAGGTGLPFCTTDYSAIQKAIELDIAKVFIMKKNIDKVYDCDPHLYLEAKAYDEVTPKQLLLDRLNADFKSYGIIDDEALTMLIDANLTVYVSDAANPKSILEILEGKKIGTTIHN